MPGSILLGVIAAALAGCPAAPPAPGAAQARRGEAYAGKPGMAQHAEPGVDPLSEAQPGASAREVPNPRPVSGDWIWIDSLTQTAGVELQVEYGIAAQAAGAPRLWICLVPAALLATDARTNHEQAVLSMEAAPSGRQAALVPVQTGRFRLRLFSSAAAGEFIAETQPFTVEQPAFTEVGTPPAPYVAIPTASGASIAVQQDFPLLAHFAIPPDCPTSIWLGVVPVGTESRDLSENMKANVSYEHVEGRSSGDFVWVAAVPGTYVIRLFAADNGACFPMVETAPFEVKAKLRNTKGDGG